MTGSGGINDILQDILSGQRSAGGGDYGAKLAKSELNVRSEREAKNRFAQRAKDAADALERIVRIAERVKVSIADESRSRQSASEMVETMLDQVRGSLNKLKSG